MDELYPTIEMLLNEGRSAVLATIVRQAGPSPRGVGAKCLIMDDGSFVGSVGGGVLEAETLKEAARVFHSGLPARLHFSLDGKDVFETDMLCGGHVEVFLEPLPIGQPSCAGLFRIIAEDLRNGQSGLLITLMDPSHWHGGVIPKMFLRRTGETWGSLPGAQVISDAFLLEGKRFGRSRTLSAGEMKDDAGTPVDVLVEPVSAPSTLYVFGAGHVSRQIVPLASRVGFRVMVVDDREEFADPFHFPTAAEVRCLPFDDIMERLPVDGASFLVIVTRGHMGDKRVLAQGLRTKARYIGMIGSKHKRKLIYQALLDEGFTQSDLERVHSPIGIDIGAETPEEIAVSIVAELIQVRAGMEEG